MIDMSAALELLERVQGQLKELDGQELSDREADRHLTARKAEVTRELLFAAHLADLVRVEVMNQYHTFKGQIVPEIVPS